MHTNIFIILFLPLFSFSQTSEVYIKLTDTKGQPIKGESVTKGYERWIKATTITSGGKNNIQLDFTMPVSGASADLKNVMSNSKFLLTGEVMVTTVNQARGTLVYSIKMEQVAVLSCAEVMGCNNSLTTTVSLQATRIGWTYYTQGMTGALTVSRKYGWDAEAGAEWTKF